MITKIQGNNTSLAKYALAKSMLFFFALIFMMFCIRPQGQAQYLQVSGKKIVDPDGNNVILRGIGLGGWMLQEGYMLRTYGPQHEIEDRIEALIGPEKKEEFYAAWLANFCTKTDIDSMAAWGYNSVRLPMHYKLFTPPIEEEPVEGEITWREEGFTMVDNLLSWVEANDMYLILDLHAAPGGQGENADISDYDRSKPSLWESEANKDKMVALWRKLAERYADEPNIGGYDLLNETNWGFENHSSDPNGCNQSSNSPLWDIQRRAIEAIREVDQNHIVIIEGNCWGNNYNGLPNELWDDNLVISYHKYWNANDQGSLGPHLATQNKWDVPIWLGETGENSNVWFTDAITLLEANNFGWAWWPQKKMGGNNVQEVPINAGYQKIIDYWNNPSNPKPSESEAYAALMQIAENTKAENNIYHYDVVDAMMRQPHDNTAIPFKKNMILPETSNLIYFTDYDLGTQGVAYSDKEYTNESGGAGGAAWNIGGGYRNDGVDIEACSDDITNGFNVGWTNDREWMQYTLEVDSSGVYELAVRYAGANQGIAKIYINEDDLSGEVSFPSTGGYQNWDTKTIEDIILTKGINVLKFYIVKGASNLNYMELTLKKKIDELNFKAVSAITSETGAEVFFNVNMDIDPATISKDGFVIKIDGEEAVIAAAVAADNSQKSMEIAIETEIKYTSQITISYSGTQIKSISGNNLEAIENMRVSSGLPVHYALPGRLNAENFFENQGLVLESTEDIGGGENNLGYTNPGDYASYYITVANEADYYVEARVASESNSGAIEFQQISLDGIILNTTQLALPVTGGWQSWQTSDAATIHLNEGRSILKMKIVKSGININYYNFTQLILGVDDAFQKENELTIYPNPSSGLVTISKFDGQSLRNSQIRIVSMEGKVITQMELNTPEKSYQLDVSKINSGMYILELSTTSKTYRHRLLVN